MWVRCSLPHAPRRLRQAGHCLHVMYVGCIPVVLWRMNNPQAGQCLHVIYVAYPWYCASWATGAGP